MGISIATTALERVKIISKGGEDHLGNCCGQAVVQELYIDLHSGELIDCPRDLDQRGYDKSLQRRKSQVATVNIHETICSV